MTLPHSHPQEAGAACPLCGRPNHCAIIQGKDPYTCWCMTARIPRELREQVPLELRGKACICQSCLKAHISRQDSAGSSMN